MSDRHGPPVRRVKSKAAKSPLQDGWRWFFSGARGCRKKDGALCLDIHQQDRRQRPGLYSRSISRRARARRLCPWSAGGIYCYPALEAPALDAGGERLAKKIDGLLSGLPDYSDERDELSVALYGDVLVLAIDGDGRISLPENLRAHAGLTTQVTFVGLGDKFQMWEPARFADRRERAREKVQHTRKLFGAGNRPSKSEDDGSEGARG